MKRHILGVVVCTCLLIQTQAFGQDKGFGAGIILGEPTGISLKQWLNDTRAVVGAVAWSFSGRDSFHLHGDYLIHDFDEFKPERGRLAYYYGAGARLLFREGRGRYSDDDVHIGVRVPLGLNYLFHTAPVDLFAEIVPLLDVAPDLNVTLEAGIGARYFFR
jgi:hypothetical protein